MDGLVLMGGGDVGPAAYGANDVAAIGVDLDRDRFEIDLVRAAVDAGLPLLAVCRGIQVLNVAHGGTLMQDIPKCEGFGTHSALTDTGQTDGLLHEVRLLSGSLVATATGRTTIEQAWSSHHQGVDQLGVGLHPVGWAPDGLVEAIEGEGNWVLGVQWHPETTADADPVQQSVYAAFVESAKASAA